MTARRRAGGLAACGASVALLAACGSSGPAPATGVLRADVLSVSRALAAGNRSAALSGLQTLQSDLAAAKRNGQVGTSEYAQIVAAEHALTSDLAGPAPASSSAPARTSTPAASAGTSRPAVPATSRAAVRTPAPAPPPGTSDQPGKPGELGKPGKPDKPGKPGKKKPPGENGHGKH